MAVLKVPILFVDPGPEISSDSLAKTALKTGLWQFPAYATKSVYGMIKIPDDLTDIPDAKIEVIIGGGAAKGGASIEVSTKIFDEEGSEYGLNLLIADAIQDFSVPLGTKRTKKLTFTGGDLANVAAGKRLWVEVRRLGGCGRLANEAEIELIGANLSIEVISTLTHPQIMTRTSLGF